MSEVGQRQPRVECPAFLAFVRRKPCSACGAPPPSQAAHLRMTDAAHPEKRPVGIGEKPSDQWANPLCSNCHLDAPDSQHNGSERAFWSRVGVDPFDNASKLWAQFERRRVRSPEQRARVVNRAKRIAKNGKNPPVRSGLRPPTWAKFQAKIRSANRWPPKGSRKIQNRSRL